MQKRVIHNKWVARPCEKYMLSSLRRCEWGECFSLYTGSRLLPLL